MATSFGTVSVATVALVVVAALAGCGTGTTRSPEAYCATVAEHRDRYLQSMEIANAGSLEGIISAVAAIGDLKSMWVELADVAPEEIRADSELVRDAWIEQEKAAASGDYAAVLANALLNAGPMGRVDAYIRETCDLALDVAPVEEADPVIDLNPGTGWATLGDMLVHGSQFDVMDAAVRGPIEVFTPESGALVLDAQELFPADDVTAQSWTVAGEPGASYAVGLVEVRVPADGLDPESWRSTIVTLDVRSTGAAITTTHEVMSSPCDGSVTGLTGSEGDAVGIVRYESDAGCNAEVFLYGIDPTSGAEVWFFDSSSAAQTFGSMVAENYDNLESDPYYGCRTFTGVDVASGDAVWTYSSHDWPDGSQCGRLDLVDFVGSAAAYDNRAQLGYSWHIQTEWRDDSGRDFSTETGDPLVIRQPLFGADPVTGYAVHYGQNLGAGREVGIVVYDTSDGAVIYELDLEQVLSLDARVVTIIGGRLFLETTDQYLEIDLDSGDIVSEEPTAYALAIVGDYAYFTDGTLQPLEEINSYRPPRVVQD